MRHQYKLPFTVGNNPWTRGLKLFSVLDSAATAVNLAGPGNGLSTKPQDQLLIYGTAGYPGLYFEDSNGEYINWERQPIGPTTGSITVVGRFKPSTGHYGALLGSMLDPGLLGGFVFEYHLTLGLVIFGAHGGSVAGAATSDPTGDAGYEYTAGATYDSVSRTFKVWKDGIKVASNTDVSQPWNSVATVELYTGRTQFGNEELDGPIFWVAFFDRALTEQEMVIWTTQDPIKLISPDDGVMTMTSMTTYLGANTVTVGSEVSVASPFNLGVELEAACALSGDLSSVPSPAAIYRGANEILVIDTQVSAATGLITAGNVVLVTNAASSIVPFAGATEIMVGSSGDTQLGNQLVGDRYRR